MAKITVLTTPVNVITINNEKYHKRLLRNKHPSFTLAKRMYSM